LFLFVLRVFFPPIRRAGIHCCSGQKFLCSALPILSFNCGPLNFEPPVRCLLLFFYVFCAICVLLLVFRCHDLFVNFMQVSCDRPMCQRAAKVTCAQLPSGSVVANRLRYYWGRVTVHILSFSHVEIEHTIGHGSSLCPYRRNPHSLM